jgi:hypothetical protein
MNNSNENQVIKLSQLGQLNGFVNDNDGIFKQTNLS